jgi:predicted  nucleic acid-binding Zn-ribbon protein
VATLTFDKLAYVDRLQAAGMGEREARALAEGLDQALREEVATKTDIAAVKTDLAAVKSELAADIAAVKTELAADIAAVKTELAADIAAVRTELKGDIASVRTELKGDIASVRTELAAVKHDMLRWIVGMGFAQTGLTVALIRFLPH